MHTATSGGRRLSVAALTARQFAPEHDEDHVVSRRELSLIARDCEQALNLRPSTRLVLHELVGVWGEKELNGRMMVWPSNEYLVDRTGLSERAVRYALNELVELQLVAPRDSANGKRFGIRDKHGAFIDAYGFDLRPLYARQQEFLEAIEAMRERRAAQMRLFDEITIARRATEEALAALAEHYPAVSRDDIEDTLEQLRKVTPRRGSMQPIDHLVKLWADLREMAEERFLDAGCGGKDCRHIETDKEPLHDPCNKALEDEGWPGRREEPKEKPLTVGMVAEACPALSTYYGKPIRNMNEFAEAARYLRPLIGAHPSAWAEAVELIGLAKASAAVVLVLQLHDDDEKSGMGRIKNPGGYFRALVRMVHEGKMDLRSELLTMRRKRMT